MTPEHRQSSLFCELTPPPFRWVMFLCVNKHIRTVDKGKEKTLSQASVWRGILTITPESCTLMFKQGIKLFTMRAPKNASPKSKRAARLDTPGVTEFAARCALMSYLMHPTHAPSLLNHKTLEKFIDMFYNGTVVEK